VFFQTGSARPSGKGAQVLALLGGELGRLPNKVRIEGHTDARPYSLSSNYTNWELSADRANAARRILTANGVAEDQIVQIRGFADRDLRLPNEPFAASNRRITITVLFAGDSGATAAPDSAAAAPADSASAAPVSTS
jgi:chemotaxis protein MotB